MQNKIDFIGIGFEKCGSTWISKCLEEHPHVLFSSQKSRKEIAFFSVRKGEKKENIAANWGKESDYKKGIDWYLEQFPKAEKGKIRGEFSPGYIRSKKALLRIKKHFPDVKIIISVRNPIDMIYSLYWYHRQSIRVNIEKDFEQIVLDGEKKILDVDKGLYYKYLKNAFDIFPKDNIHLIFFEDIKNNPQKVVEELYRFLDVDNSFKPSILNKKVNPSAQIRFIKVKKVLFKITKWLSDKENTCFPDLIDGLFENKKLYKIYQRLITFSWKKKTPYPQMKKETRKKIVEYYKKDIKKTEELINRDLFNWLII